MDTKGIADFFVIAGVPEKGRKIDTESNPLRRLDPIIDITVINRSNEEPIPIGWECIEATPSGYEADLNHGSLRSSSMFLCYKRGREKPPLIDIGVIYYDGKEKLVPTCHMVEKTPSGFSANVNNSGTQTHFTYRRSSETAPCNQLVVTDICVIFQNKGDQPPHAYCLINKNLNKGFIGSDVFVCYKKSMDRPQYIPYYPEIIDRFSFRSLQYSFPNHVELFCLPLGASIECWPSKAIKSSPSYLTFVLTSAESEKLYGSTLNFYETISHTELTFEELKLLEYIDSHVETCIGEDYEQSLKKAQQTKTIQRIKSIGILSQWPFFDQFKRFLSFLHRSYVDSQVKPLTTSLESYIFYFLKDVHFPLPERPDIFVNLLGESDEDSLIFNQSFDDLPLPSNGASFKKMLLNLGPENCVVLLLFALTEQKILLHSLRPSILTEIAEGLLTMIFPFYWPCPYIPMCPIMMSIGGNQKISMSDFLGAPMPFIVGIDSRYFDHNIEPPNDVASIDIDTRSIYLCETKRHLTLNMMPKKEKETLLNTLKSIFDRLRRYSSSRATDPNVKLKMERQFETEIQEAFLYFMAQILKDFRQFLKPITAAPRVGATDASSLFDIEGFLQSRNTSHQPFYDALMRTQMFTRFIEERSLVSDKNVSLAFFDECIEKVEKHKKKVNLIEYEDRVHSNKTVFIAIPDSPVKSHEKFTYSQFGPLDHQIFLKLQKDHGLSDSLVMTDTASNQSINDSLSIGPNSELHCYSYAKRAKHEIRKSQRFAVQAARSPVEWSKYLLFKSYCLWFTHFPAFSHFLRENDSKRNSLDPNKTRPLSIAYEVLQRMQSMKFAASDEFCYRILMILCSIHSQPALAVKVFLSMSKYRIKLNAITYGYYNKAVLEGNWPNEAKNDRWSKLRNIVRIVWHLKRHIKVNLTDSDQNEDNSSLSISKTTKGQGRQTNKCDCHKPTPPIDHLRSAGTLMLTQNPKLGGSYISKEDERQKIITRKTSLNDLCPHKNLPEIKQFTIKLKNGHANLANKKEDTEIDSVDSRGSQTETKDNTSQRSEEDAQSGDHSFVRFTTPIKEAFSNSEIFSPKSRFGLTLRSSLRLAKNFTKHSKYGFSSPMTRASEKNLSKVDSLPRVLENVSTPTTQAIHRSSTLPQTLNRMDQSTPVKHPQSTPTPSANSSFSSPWSTKFNSKHSEYVVSTFKMAANRLNELKSSLTANSSSGTSSPVKLNMANMMDRGSLLLSQLKNYAFDEVESDKTFDSSFEMFMEFDEANFNIEEYRKFFELVESYNSKQLESIVAMNQQRSDQIIFEIEMVSCTVCRHCGSIIFDEDIMAKWTANDSNLNTSCPFCMTTFVPRLKILIKDYRPTEEVTSNGIDSAKGNQSSHQPFRQLDSISVPYISPLVLRKELESILHNEGYANLVATTFVDQHPIVYWNLLWYFNRLNLPSHLSGLALYASTLHSDQLVQVHKKFPYDHRNVSIICLWERGEFYDVIPFYKMWFRLKCVTENKRRNSLKQLSLVYMELIEVIKNRDLMRPIQYLISMRKADSSSNQYFNSIYRDILFLALSELKPNEFDINTFDVDYKSAVESLPSKDRDSMKKVDSALSIGAIFCRNLFRQLCLEVAIDHRPSSTILSSD